MPGCSIFFFGLKLVTQVLITPKLSVFVKSIRELFMRKIIFSYLPLTFVLGTQKNRLIERVLLSIHNVCFGCERRQFILRHSYLRPA